MPDPALPKVSVIVLNYNGAHLLPDCLESLQRQDWPNLEIIVADNGSSDNSRAVAEGLIVRFFSMERNYGYSVGNNKAAGVCSGEYLLFLNNDTRVERSSVRILVETLLSDPAIFSADPRVLSWDGTCVIHHPFRFAPGPFFHSRFPEVRCVGIDGNALEIPWGCGSSLMVRRRMFESLGGFDATFLYDWEDVDLCWRAWLRGWKTIHVPAARIYHKVGATFQQVNMRHPNWVRIRRAREGNKNYLRFVLKTMPPRLVCLVILRDLCRIPLELFSCDWAMASAYLSSMFWTAVALPDILRERRRLLSGATLSSSVLIGRFSGTVSKR